MLTKKQIEAIEIGGRDDEWEMSGDLSMDDARELRRLALLGLERDERMNEALSGEADAVRRAESAELGCEIAYRREPTQDEGDANEDEDGECFVAMGGWTGRRCRVCNRWTWGGPTACVACAAREERDERAERVGRAVLAFGYSRSALRNWANHLQLEDAAVAPPIRLLRAIADAMEEP